MKLTKILILIFIEINSFSDPKSNKHIEISRNKIANSNSQNC